MPNLIDLITKTQIRQGELTIVLAKPVTIQKTSFTEQVILQVLSTSKNNQKSGGSSS